MTTNEVTPDPAKAWREVDSLKALLPPTNRDLRIREAQMLVAAALVRAGAPDSASALLIASRAGPDVDPRGNLLTVEAFVRTLFKSPKDTDEAFRLLKQYVSSNPAHRQGFVESQSWWWRPLKADPRFRELTGGAGGR